MRIAIEVSPQLGGKRGIGLYTENLLKALAALDRENEYVVVTWFYRDHERKLASLCLPEAPNFSVAAWRLPDSLVTAAEWRLRLPIVRALLAGRGIDVYHSPGLRLPRLGCRTVVTAHDLISEKFPQWTDQRLRHESRRAALAADAIVADSECTRKDLCGIYGVPAGKVDVVSLGVDRSVFRPMPREEARKACARYALPDDFILEVGPFEPRRNTATLIKAFALAKGSLAGRKLVLVGREDAAMTELAAGLGVDRDIIFISRLSTAELAAVYGLASMFVHPSLYEGFGLSLLEAMACGAPCLISDIASLPEIGGEACLKLKNAQDPAELAGLMARVAAEPGLAERLKEAGTARAANFTWERTARETLAVYRKAAAIKSGL
jgi:glycosyltransferase involved in cell wall biosynthesis